MCTTISPRRATPRAPPRAPMCAPPPTPPIRNAFFVVLPLRARCRPPRGSIPKNLDRQTTSLSKSRPPGVLKSLTGSGGGETDRARAAASGSSALPAGALRARAASCRATASRWPGAWAGQLGQKERHVQEKASRYSCVPASQRMRAKLCSSTPQARKWSATCAKTGRHGPYSRAKRSS